MAEIEQKPKFVKFDPVKWFEHSESAKKLKAERGHSKLGIAEYLNEAANFFERNRPRTTK